MKLKFYYDSVKSLQEVIFYYNSLIDKLNNSESSLLSMKNKHPNHRISKPIAYQVARQRSKQLDK